MCPVVILNLWMCEIRADEEAANSFLNDVSHVG